MNKVICKDWLDNELPDKCAKLIIMDPPYYEVKGDFDFIWPTFADYLADVELWAAECKRVLADNGTLLWYGDRKKIAYSQIILDKYFKLEAAPVVHFKDRQTRKTRPEDARSFINVTERLLMYSNEVDEYGLMWYFKDERLKAGLNYAQCDEIMGIKASYCYWDKPTTHPFRIPERQHYEKLRATSYWPRPYADILQEYETQRRYFHPPEEFKTDVITVSQEAHITGKYDHPTAKPERLSRVLIQSTTRRGDLVVVPMAGSGTECDMCQDLGRPFYGSDIDPKSVAMSNKRIFSNLKLF